MREKGGVNCFLFVFSEDVKNSKNAIERCIFYGGSIMYLCFFKFMCGYYLFFLSIYLIIILGFCDKYCFFLWGFCCFLVCVCIVVVVLIIEMRVFFF